MSKKLDMDEVRSALERQAAQTYRPVKPAVQRASCITTSTASVVAPAGSPARTRTVSPRAALPARDVCRGGHYPDVFAYKVNMSCNHCADPACLPTCPTGAIWKRADNGVVDIDSTLCIGCRRCEAACPYGAPQWDPTEHIVKKCNMCIDELEAGRKPYCVMACMMRVLDIGPIDALRAGTYPTTAVGPGDRVTGQVKDMANPALTHPSIVFVPHRRGRVDE